MELKTLEVLEGRVEGMWNNAIDLTDDDDDFYDDFSNIPVKQEPEVEPTTSVEDDFDVLMTEEEDFDESGTTREDNFELPESSESPRNLEDDLMDDEMLRAFLLCEDSEEDFIDNHLKSFA
jgi:hypothetical protein